MLGWDDSDRFLQALRAVGYPFSKDNVMIRTEDHLVQWELAGHRIIRVSSGAELRAQIGGDRSPL